MVLEKCNYIYCMTSMATCCVAKAVYLSGQETEGSRQCNLAYLPEDVVGERVSGNRYMERKCVQPVLNLTYTMLY
jgi:hypothetical protein